MRMVDERRIIEFYRTRHARPSLTFGEPLSGITLNNTAQGLGDTIILSDLPRAATAANRAVTIFSNSSHFDTLCSFNPYYEYGVRTFHACASSMVANYDLGNGHFFQRLERAFGISPELVPRGCVVVDGSLRQPDRVVIHLEPGSWAKWQRRHIHPRARQIYPETRIELQSFVLSQRHLQFFEVGNTSSGLVGVEDWTGLPLDETIRRMATCEYFVGIMSGPIHIAAALNLKLVTIVNFPKASEIVLPVLKDIDQVEAEWFYPQSVILHQERDGSIVKKVSANNLSRAFNGELYPYWSDRYLPLIFERL